jgi:hypothetical protein
VFDLLDFKTDGINLIPYLCFCSVFKELFLNRFLMSLVLATLLG